MKKVDFMYYEKQFKALADKKRLEIVHELTQCGRICVGDLCNHFGLGQSKLSYHLKILLDAGIIQLEKEGTTSYYILNKGSVNRLLAKELCCVFRTCTCCMEGGVANDQM